MLKKLKKFKKLKKIEDDRVITSGSIVRWFDVKRVDRIDDEEHDFYDLMIVNTEYVQEKSFILLNVTPDNPNAGHIYMVFTGIKQLTAKHLKKYFEGARVYIKISGEII